jgi:molecular chaperone GrpE
MAKKAVENKEELKNEVPVEEAPVISEEIKEEIKEEAAPKKKRGRKSKKDAELEELKIKHAELNDKHLRLFSEFDNFRKRTLKERLELTKTASADVILQLLPILDDFERAIKAAEEGQEKDSMTEGIKLIYNKFKSNLSAKGLEPMNCVGKEFDTDFHEAITQIPSPTEDDKGKILDEIEKGYMLGGKVIRYAKVVIGN